MALIKKTNNTAAKSTVNRFGKKPAMAVKSKPANPALGEISAVLKDAGIAGKSSRGKETEIHDGTLYIGVNASGMAGITRLLTPNTKRLVGVTNLDGETLGVGRNVVPTAIRCLFTTVGTKVENADWQNNDRLPAELQNAELVMIQGGQRILNFPLSDLQGQKFEDFRRIDSKKVVKHSEPVELYIEMPQGVSAPVESVGNADPLDDVRLFVRIEMRVKEALN